MVTNRIQEELKKLLHSDQIQALSQQLQTYEKKVREAVKEFDLRSRDARQKGQEKLGVFTSDLKKTRTRLESQFRIFLDKEKVNLNKGLQDLMAYLKTLSQTEITHQKRTSKKSTSSVSKAKSAGRAKKKKIAPENLN
jgi:uncharacterized membrane protein YgcG